MVKKMIDAINKPENLFLVEYDGKSYELELNWGFANGYVSEQKLPLLFVFSNFPTAIDTNKGALVGSLRTFMEERKGIIFFPTHLKDTIEELVELSLKRENVSLVTQRYLDKKFTDDFFKEVCNKKFSIENITITEVRKMVQQTIQQSQNVHKELLKNLDESKDKDVVCFILDKDKREIRESHNLEKKTTAKKKLPFSDIIKEKAFKTQFIDLFLSDKSMPSRIKGYLGGRDWKFENLLIFYSSRHKRTFIQDVPGSAFFLNSSDDTFMLLNTKYPLVCHSYEKTPEQKLTIAKDNITQRYEIFIDGTPEADPGLRLDMIDIFVKGMESVNTFLELITHTRTNECRFFFDQMCIFVKNAGNKCIIETYPAK